MYPLPYHISACYRVRKWWSDWMCWLCNIYWATKWKEPIDRFDVKWKSENTFVSKRQQKKTQKREGWHCQFRKAGLHHPPVPDFKWLCAGSMCVWEREREGSRVCLERSWFHSSRQTDRQTDTYSLPPHNRGDYPTLMWIHPYFTYRV